MIPIIASIAPSIKAIFQIAILAWIIFYIFNLFRGTRSAQMLSGFLTVFGGLVFVSLVFDLDVLRAILGKLPLILATALIVVFQPEIRQAFLAIGRRRVSLNSRDAKEVVVDAVCQAAETLAMRKNGALIVLERNTHLLEFAKSGTPLNAPVVPQLLTQIFYPNTPLHDGAVIIKGETILAARCILPLSASDLSRGTRHRAALGLSEKSDAVVVVVSEETGSISIACDARLIQNISKDLLRRYLERLLRREKISDIIKRSINDLSADRLVETEEQ